MKIIYKYKLSIRGLTKLKLKKDSKILSCHNQGNDIFIWVMSNCFIEEFEERSFYSIFTGIDFSLDVKFIGTVHTESSGLVIHVFEI